MATQEPFDALHEQLRPSFRSVSAPSGPRQMKATLRSAHLADVSDFLVDGLMPSEVYNRAKQDLHGKFVESYLSGQAENPIIRPYPIHPSEESLPREFRSLLAQLRFPQHLQAQSQRRHFAHLPTL